VVTRVGYAGAAEIRRGRLDRGQEGDEDRQREEHRKLIAAVAALLIAVVVSAGLGVLANVAAVGLDASMSPAASKRRSPPAGLPDPGRQPAALF